MGIKKPIHLLYVPTIFCNMSCKYCYLGELTNENIDSKQAINTLEVALEKLLEKGYIPFNLSFHGGEVTTLPNKTLEELFKISHNYYNKYQEDIEALGFKVNPIHIKTNLYNLKKHFNSLKKYQVSISGSVDLPLHLHEKYRVDKNNKSTLFTILENLKLLSSYSYNKKISCVVTKEHLKYIDDFIEDIKYIHYEIGLDMTKFNIMFSFDSTENKTKFEYNPNLQMLTDEEQVEFYKKIKQAFMGTDLEYGLTTHWFKEFTPEFCCSAQNCGDRFFLLQSDGDVFSCPRGQASKKYFYGNIFKDNIETIINNGWKSIERNENMLDVSQECLCCSYFPYCNMGCTFVRDETKMNKSYTCKLQLEIYKDNPDKYPPFEKEYLNEYIKQYLYRNNRKKLTTYDFKKVNISNELYEDKNSILNIIQKDPILKKMYLEKLFLLKVNGEIYNLYSPILKNKSDILLLNDKSTIELYVNKDIFLINSNTRDSVNNYIHIMLLRDTKVIYGDEEREKQEHIFDYSLYKNSFIELSKLKDDFFIFNLKPIIDTHRGLFRENIRNNMFFTTKTIKEYHYSKQKKNAFYHIQAINLPFPNIEFYWIN